VRMTFNFERGLIEAKLSGLEQHKIPILLER
jgi:hypothetical protein